MPELTPLREVTLVKLGGSLITDKERPLTPRVETLSRLAEELARAGLAGALVIGHGSGSFGHVTAARHEIHRGARTPEQVEGVAATQVHAHRLHRLVVETLWRAGCRPFSLAPSSCLTASAGRRGALDRRPLTLALELGLVPVTFGDVLMDAEWGASICSTEMAFEAIADALSGSRWRIARVLWMGATDGIWDAAGRTLPSVDASNVEVVLAGLSSGSDRAAGEDVTGGMRLRLETAWRLAGLGIESWILDGLRPEVLLAALGGERRGGTVVSARG
jgi:isopentenyl phosphate kinase